MTSIKEEEEEVEVEVVVEEYGQKVMDQELDRDLDLDTTHQALLVEVEETIGLPQENGDALPHRTSLPLSFDVEDVWWF